MRYVKNRKKKERKYKICIMIHFLQSYTEILQSGFYFYILLIVTLHLFGYTWTC